jgi:hypothetical protein
MKRNYLHTSLLICLFFAVLSTGCSLVQWLPSSACEYVEYVRVGDQVEVKASCRV